MYFSLPNLKFIKTKRSISLTDNFISIKQKTMKKIVLALTLVFSFSMTKAQSISVKESNEKFADGSHNALTVSVLYSTKDKVEKEWKSFIKQYNPEKVSDKKGEYFADNAVFKLMGNNPVDVYWHVEELKGDKVIRLICAYNLGGAYLNSNEHKEQFEVARKMMYDFAVKLSKEAVDEELKAATKLLEKSKEKQADLEKHNANLAEHIVDYNDKIKKAQEDIKKAEADIEKTKKDIELKKKEVDEEQKALDAVKAKMEAIK